MPSETKILNALIDRPAGVWRIEIEEPGTLNTLGRLTSPKRALFQVFGNSLAVCELRDDIEGSPYYHRLLDHDVNEVARRSWWLVRLVKLLMTTSIAWKEIPLPKTVTDEFSEEGRR